VHVQENTVDTEQQFDVLYNTVARCGVRLSIYKGAQSWWGCRLACLAGSLAVHVSLDLEISALAGRAL
jgi:hypothetical protein